MMKHRWLTWIVLLAAAPAAAAAPERIDIPGTWIHQGTRAAFPEQIGEFRRVNLYRYDEAGANVSASYSLLRPEGRLHLTVYVYPRPRLPGLGPEETCHREYEETVAFILRQHDGGGRIEEGTAPAVEGASGRRSVFRYTTDFDGRAREVRSELALYCGVGGEWQVKYRATSPAGFDASAEVETFIRTGPWPDRSAEPERVAAASARGDDRRPAPAAMR